MRFRGRIFFVLALAFFAEGAFASDCISQRDMAEIARDFQQFSDLANNEFCPDGSERSNLLVGINFMRETSFDPKMDRSRDELFSGRFATNWYQYFADRINRIVIDEGCPKGVGAYVMGFGSTMWVCTMLLTDQFVGLDRASVFMHEARHLDGFPHTTCNKGARAGIRGACDHRISDGGSYAVSVETYAQLARYATNVHPALKAYSKASAVVYADEAFNTPARVERKDTFLLLSKNGDFFSLEEGQDNPVQQLGSAPALGHLVKRAELTILLPDNKALAAQYISTNDEGTIPQQPRSAEEYNKATPDQRARLIDLHIGGQWTAEAHSSEVTMACDPRSDAKRTLPLKGETPVTFVYPDGYDRAKFETLLLMESGNVYKVGCRSKTAYVSKSQFTFDRSFVRVHKSANRVLGLTESGELYEIVGNNSHKIATAIDGQIHDFIASQNFDFFE